MHGILVQNPTHQPMHETPPWVVSMAIWADFFIVILPQGCPHVSTKLSDRCGEPPKVATSRR